MEEMRNSLKKISWETSKEGRENLRDLRIDGRIFFVFKGIGYEHVDWSGPVVGSFKNNNTAVRLPSWYSWDSSVGKVTGYGLDDQMIEV
jgi:hypothetical protein